MADIIQIKKQGVKQYPITKTECVVDGNNQNQNLSVTLQRLFSSIDDKQNWISDLETIRAGAAKGAKALQRVPDGYATTEYVDKAVAQGGGSSVFEAIYRETSYDQIIEAYNKGEQIICKNGTSIFYPITVTDAYVYFSSRNQTVGTLLVCSKTNGWSLITTFLETNSNKTQSVSENSTATEYPTAKAVYEAIQQNKIKFEEVESTEPTAEFPHVLYSEQQLTDSQKTQVRQNIGVEDYVNNAIASAITNELNSNF